MFFSNILNIIFINLITDFYFFPWYLSFGSSIISGAYVFLFVVYLVIYMYEDKLQVLKINFIVRHRIYWIFF